MKIYPSLLLFLFALSTAQNSQAGFDINLNDHAVRGTFDYLGDPRKKDLVTDMGLLYAAPEQGNSTIVTHLGLNSGTEDLRLGMRAILANPDGGDVLALGLGLQGRLWLSPTLSFSGHAYYAPQITSLLDSRGYREISVRLNFRINRNDDIYVGYRSLQVKLDGFADAIEIDEDLMLGIKLNF